MSEIKVGELTTIDYRDAIHIAVYPIEAKNTLKAGIDIGISDDGFAEINDRPVGIVDPFLKHDVKKGERFFIFLYPNTVTGMTHHWQHPSIDNKEQDLSKESIKKQIDRICSEINQNMGFYVNFTYDSVIYLAEKYWVNGDFYCGNYEECDFHEYYIRLHPLLIKLGVNLPELDSKTHFRCTC